jgi:hypothetical protein
MSKQYLAPTLKRKDIVVIDNLLRRSLGEAGAGFGRVFLLVQFARATISPIQSGCEDGKCRYDAHKPYEV